MQFENLVRISSCVVAAYPNCALLTVASPDGAAFADFCSEIAERISSRRIPRFGIKIALALILNLFPWLHAAIINFRPSFFLITARGRY